MATKAIEKADQTGPSELVRKTFEEAAKSMIAPEGSSDDMLLDILNAESVDDILSSNAVGLETIIGQPMTIDSAVLRKSDYEGGLAAYLVMHVTMDNGDKLVVTSGAQSVIAQVIRMNQLDVLPYRVASRKSSKSTEAGYYPVSLVKAPERIEQF